MSISCHSNIFTINEINTILKTIFRSENESKWSINKHFWEDGIQNKSIGVVSIFRIEGSLRALIEKVLSKFLKPGEQFQYQVEQP